MNYIQSRKEKGKVSNNKKRKFHFKGKRKNRKAVSPINTELLIKKAIDKPGGIFSPSRSFNEMPIDQRLKDNLSARGFHNPTQIQHETLELLKAGNDLVGVATTGTGKTAAFLIPVIERLLSSASPFQTLVIVPTRELALQVEKEFENLTNGLNLKSVCFIGGTNVERDVKRSRKVNHLIVGTPGRLLDLVARRALRLDQISTLVLDEFDRMLDMGFVNDIQRIISLMTERKQTMMFSATLDKTQRSLIDQLLTNPKHIQVSGGTSSSDHVDQDIVRISKGENKFEILREMMTGNDFEKVLVFAETKHLVNKLTKKLNQAGVRSDQIHGNKSQHYRNNALDRFKRGKVQVLVATDVAARGIDVFNISHVINYQVPQNMESYVHRIGRTGRAGKRGKALTFVE